MKGYQFKSAWAFRRGCRNSPLELLCPKETRLPNSNNNIWIDWWFETIVNGGSGILKHWTGSAWNNALIKVFTGASWQSKPLKQWNGTEWILLKL